MPPTIQIAENDFSPSLTALKIAVRSAQTVAPPPQKNSILQPPKIFPIEDAFRYGKLVLATTTYNGDVFPKMKEFILHLSERTYQKRTIALIENGSWVPAAAKKMSDMLSSLKDVKILDNKVTIKIAVTQEVVAQLEALAEELLR